MKKRSFWLFLALLVLALIAGCDDQGDSDILGPQLFEDEEENESTISVVPEIPYFVNIEEK